MSALQRGFAIGALAASLLGCGRAHPVQAPPAKASEAPPAKASEPPLATASERPPLAPSAKSPADPAPAPSAEAPRSALPTARSWSADRDALLAEYQRRVPPSDEDYYAAEKASLGVEAHSAEWVTLSAILDPKRRDGTLRRDWCRAQLAPAEVPQFEGCNLKQLGNGAALLLTLTTECGGDSCSVLGWVRTAELRQFTRLSIDVGGTIEATPDGTALLYDSVASPDDAQPTPQAPNAQSPAARGPRVTTRLYELATRSTKPFAECFSMQLSPQSKYFLCRDAAANVLAIPVLGGTPKRIAASGFRASQIDNVLYAYIWPEPVSFPKPNRLAFTIQRAGDAEPNPITREIAWRE